MSSQSVDLLSPSQNNHHNHATAAATTHDDAASNHILSFQTDDANDNNRNRNGNYDNLKNNNNHDDDGNNCDGNNDNGKGTDGKNNGKDNDRKQSEQRKRSPWRNYRKSYAAAAGVAGGGVGEVAVTAGGGRDGGANDEYGSNNDNIASRTRNSSSSTISPLTPKQLNKQLHQHQQQHHHQQQQQQQQQARKQSKHHSNHNVKGAKEAKEKNQSKHPQSKKRSNSRQQRRKKSNLPHLRPHEQQQQEQQQLEQQQQQQLEQQRPRHLEQQRPRHLEEEEEEEEKQQQEEEKQPPPPPARTNTRQSTLLRNKTAGILSRTKSTSLLFGSFINAMIEIPVCGRLDGVGGVVGGDGDVGGIDGDGSGGDVGDVDGSGVDGSGVGGGGDDDNRGNDDGYHVHVLSPLTCPSQPFMDYCDSEDEDIDNVFDNVVVNVVNDVQEGTNKVHGTIVGKQATLEGGDDIDGNGNGGDDGENGCVGDKNCDGDNGNDGDDDDCNGYDGNENGSSGKKNAMESANNRDRFIGDLNDYDAKEEEDNDHDDNDVILDCVEEQHQRKQLIELNAAANNNDGGNANDDAAAYNLECKFNSNTNILINDSNLAGMKKRGKRYKQGATYKALVELEQVDDADVDSAADDDMNNENDDQEEENKGEEQQQSSPSLLPLPIPHPTTRTSPQPMATAANTNPNAMQDTNPSSSCHELILTVHSELENLGKALKCPLCQYTLRQATILPCVHAFCGPCITTAFCPPPTTNNRNDKKNRKQKKKTSPTRRPTDQCPICKLKCSRRSMVRSEHLDELVRGYKMTLRAFGLAPIVHGAGVQMTQLDPEEDGEMDDDDEEEEKGDEVDGIDVRKDLNQELTASKRNKTLQSDAVVDVAKLKSTSTGQQKLQQLRKRANLKEYQQHLQVTRVVHGAFLNAQQQPQQQEQQEQQCHEIQAQSKASSNSGTATTNNRTERLQRQQRQHQPCPPVKQPPRPPRITKEELEQRARVQKYRILAQEQDAVVRVDEEALKKAARVTRKQANDGATTVDDAAPTATATDTAAAATVAGNDLAAIAAVAPCPTVVVDAVDETINIETVENSNNDAQTSAMSQEAKCKIKNPIDENGCIPTLANGMESTLEEFCTAPDGYSMEYSTAREDSQAFTLASATAPSPTVFHDGNTVRKAERPRRNFQLETIQDADDTGETNRSTCRTTANKTRNQSIATANLSPIQVHDGNTVQKDRNGSGSNYMLLDSSVDDPTPRRSGKKPPRSEAVELGQAIGDKEKDAQELDDRKIAAKRDNEVGEEGCEDQDETFTYTADGEDDLAPKFGVTSKQGRKRLRLSSVQFNLPVNEKMDNIAPDLSENQQTNEGKERIGKGSIVMVQSRTWPGINKHGGVARVVKVHKATGNSAKYDLAYILGGREKDVDESFLSLHDTNSPSQEEEDIADITFDSKNSKTKSSRQMRQRKIATKQKAPSSSGTAIPIFNEETLKEIPSEVLEWAGIVPTQNKKKGKVKDKSPDVDGKDPKNTQAGSKKEAPRGKKRPFKESNQNKIPSASKKKKQKDAPKSSIDPPRATVVSEKEIETDSGRAVYDGGLNDIIGSLSAQDIVRIADEKYSSLLSLNDAASTSNAPAATLCAVTSSLSDEDSDILDKFCKMLKNKNVTLKIMKDFQPDRTQICITSAASPPSSSASNSSLPMDVVSKSRTLKVMRSALAGLPIVTPNWMDACLEESCVVAPTGAMAVRTMPRKRQNAVGRDREADDAGNDHPTEQFGVAKYAAAFQQRSIIPSADNMSSKHLLSGVAVMMCGTWKMTGASMKRDLKVLLQEAGATIINSASMAIKSMSHISQGKSEGRFIFLCDDSPIDKDCGISDALHREAKLAINSKYGSREKVLAVHFNWLFDCVSCATLMPPAAYEPWAPKSKELWSLIYGDQTNRRKQSQTY